MKSHKNTKAEIIKKKCREGIPVTEITKSAHIFFTAFMLNVNQGEGNKRIY